ncbi:MAG: hypothetical protein ACRDJN_25620, partial [Chloroflexota bacterium]
DYPDPADPFYGYARSLLTDRDGTIHHTTRGLVRTVLSGAMALLAWKAQRYVTHKGARAAAYREHIGGPWADFIAAVDQACRIEWGYLVPGDPAGRARLRALCREMPAFENELLEQHRSFLLEELGRAAVTADGKRGTDGIDERGGEAWLPAELAGWLLELSPDDVQALGTAGQLVSTMVDGRRLFAFRPSLERWAAAMFGRVLYPADSATSDALDALAGSDSAVVRHAARAARTARTAWGALETGAGIGHTDAAMRPRRAQRTPRGVRAGTPFLPSPYGCQTRG